MDGRGPFLSRTLHVAPNVDTGYDSKLERRQQTTKNHKCVSRSSTRNCSVEYKVRNPQRLFFQEALKRERQLVFCTIEQFIGKIHEDMETISETIRKQDADILKLYSSHKELDKSYSAAVKELTMKSNARDKRTCECMAGIKQNKAIITERWTQRQRDKSRLEDSVIQNVAEHILEFCKMREEIEVLRTKCKKEFAASDEQRRISNDSTRFRLQTLNNFTNNAIKVWANEQFLALSRTENKIMDRLKQQRRMYITNKEYVKKKVTSDLGELDKKISIVENEAKCLIPSVVKQLENLEKTVDKDSSTNEDFRKIARSYMATSKSQSERVNEMLTIKNGLDTRLTMIEAKLDVLNNVSDSKYAKCLQELKNHNDIIMKQTQYLSRRVRILLQHIGK